MVNVLSILKAAAVTPIMVSADEHGIPYVDYGIRFGRQMGRVYNPLTVAIRGLQITGNDKLFGGLYLPMVASAKTCDVRQIADWLVAHEQSHGDWRCWYNDFYWPTYRLVPPWRSALAEALGGFFLLSVGDSFVNSRYRESGIGHLNALSVDTNKGGLRLIIKGGGSRFPECTDYKNIEPPLILNGMLYALLALHFSYLETGDPGLRMLYDSGIRQLRSDLHFFDGGYFTYYDSVGNPANQAYHLTHVLLLSILVRISGDSVLNSYLARWSKMRSNYQLRELVSHAQTTILRGRLPYST